MGTKINLINLIKDINEELSQNTMDLNSNFKEENNVSELHIHKILFIIYGAFYKKYNKDLFNPSFEAWKYGPVEIDFRSNKEKKLDKFDFTFQTKEEEEDLKMLITKLLKFSPWSLVDYTHTMDAWTKNYNNENEKMNKISKEDIVESFKDINFF